MLNRRSEHRLLRVRQGNDGGSGGTGGAIPSPGGDSDDNDNAGGAVSATSSFVSTPAGSGTSQAAGPSSVPSSIVPETTPGVSSTTIQSSAPSSVPSSVTSTSQSVAPSPLVSSQPPSTAPAEPSSSPLSSSIVTSSSASISADVSRSTGTIEELGTSRFLVDTNTGTRSVRQSTRTSADIGGSTVSASAPASQSGALNTGAMAGGIAGGLIALAIFGFILCFFIRRRRNRNRVENFNASQFRRSAMIMDDDAFTPTPPTPQMFERGHNVAPSISSSTAGGPGMAGQGAYYTGGTQPQHDFVDQYSDHPYAMSPSPRPQPALPLQERQQYTFGQLPSQHYDPNGMDDGLSDGHGPYSSEPQMQTSHNPEAYSGYHAYSPTVPVAAGYSAGAHARVKSTHTVIDDAYGGI